MRLNRIFRSKINISGIYKTWFLKCLGSIFLSLILIAVCSLLFISKHLYENQKVQFERKVNLMYSFIENEKVENLNYVFNKTGDLNGLNIAVYNGNGSILYENGDIFSKINLKFDENQINKTSNFKIDKSNCFMILKKTGTQEDVHYVVFIYLADPLKKNITNVAFILFLILMLILFFLFFLSKKFIRSIVSQIGEVSKMSRRIALGDFRTRIVKKSNDELGELCDTINYMAQKLFESEQMKNDFISSVSHELRTPLTAIKGWAETIVLDGVTTEEDKRMNKKGLEIIVHESERLYSIVEELLDFSKLQSGRMILNLEKMDVLAELSETVYIFRKRAEEENKILLYSETENVPAILGDKNRLKQVFINIIDNALKYTVERGVINISAKESGNFVNIEISDNGRGISKEDLPKVTNKFYKGKYSKNGSGIGLALANELILLHSGQLEIKSEENIGTIVDIYLPKMIKSETLTSNNNPSNVEAKGLK